MIKKIDNVAVDSTSVAVQSETRNAQLNDTMNSGECSVIDQKFQLIMRDITRNKLSTRRKALQSLIDIIPDCDSKSLQSILPHWPELYVSLANDTDHHIRQLAQIVLQTLMKRAPHDTQPYVKQMLPVWLISQFDCFAPAAEVAKRSFSECCSSNVVQLLLSARNEIFDYISRNLTFHTASTLATKKGITLEAAKQKYHRIVAGSLKALLHYVNQTCFASDVTEIQKDLQTLLAHYKFRSYAQYRVTAIKAAWFELLHAIVKAYDMESFSEETKAHMVKMCLQNIDETIPVVAEQVWLCVTKLQRKFKNWYKTIAFNKTVLPKFFELLRHGWKNNATAICPHLQPFFSGLSCITLGDIDYSGFCKRFFNDFKYGILTTVDLSEKEYEALTKAYFDCIRFIFQQMDNATNDDNNLGSHLVRENICQPLMTLFFTVAHKPDCFFVKVSALVQSWEEQWQQSTGDRRQLYWKWLDVFWSWLRTEITGNIQKKNCNENYIIRVMDFISCLSKTNNKKKISYAVDRDHSLPDGNGRTSGTHTTTTAISYQERELKSLVIQLVHHCMEEKNLKNMCVIRPLLQSFAATDLDFYLKLTEQGNLSASLNYIADLVTAVDVNGCDFLIQVIFQILQRMDKSAALECITSKLLNTSAKHFQLRLLKELLSFTHFTPSETRSVLAHPETVVCIKQIAQDAICNFDNEKYFEILEKAFFPSNAFNTALSIETADEIVYILCEPLSKKNGQPLPDVLDICAMHLIKVVNKEQCSKTAMVHVFLTFFRVSLAGSEYIYVNNGIRDDIKRCWQGMLTSGFLSTNDDLIKETRNIIKEIIVSPLSIKSINSIVDSLRIFLEYSLHNVLTDAQRMRYIELFIKDLLFIENELKREIDIFLENCLILEAIHGAITLYNKNYDYKRTKDLGLTLRYVLVNIGVVLEVLHYLAEENIAGIEWDREFLQSFIHNMYLYINVGSVAYSSAFECVKYMEHSETNKDIKCVFLIEEIKNKGISLMKCPIEIIVKLKDHMLAEALTEINVSACRSLHFLTHFGQFAIVGVNPVTSLAEYLWDYFLARNAMKPYINTTQYLMPVLESRILLTPNNMTKLRFHHMYIRASFLRCIVANWIEVPLIGTPGKALYEVISGFINELTEFHPIHQDLLMFDMEVGRKSLLSIMNVVEYIQLIKQMIYRLPMLLANGKVDWNILFIGLSNWVLSMSKSMADYAQPKVAIFIATVCDFSSFFMQFLEANKKIWNSMSPDCAQGFQREINITLFKSFYKLCKRVGCETINMDIYRALIKKISNTMQHLDCSHIYHFCCQSRDLTESHVVNFLLENFSCSIHSQRIQSLQLLKNFTKLFVERDISAFERRTKHSDVEEEDEDPHGDKEILKNHYLIRFGRHLDHYGSSIEKYLRKIPFENDHRQSTPVIDNTIGFAYLILWDCILYVCANCPIHLRLAYTDWLMEKKYFYKFLHFLFQAMPINKLQREANANECCTEGNCEAFKCLTWSDIKDENLSIEDYACHLYAEMLRKLPMIVREWVQSSALPQQLFVKDITKNFVSPQLCREQLSNVIRIQKNSPNISIEVYPSTRNVVAIYSLGKNPMELSITLAANHPLKPPEIIGHINEKNRKTTPVQQLSTFFTHQLGTIADCLTQWQQNPLQTFDFIDECYLCYGTLHPETNLLPKSVCKTCKMKFHDTCLNIWFKSTRKSSCPICRQTF